MENVSIENDYVKIWIEDGIIHNVYKPNLEINILVAKQMVRDRLRISNGKSYPLFIDMSNMVSVDIEAREYLAGGEAVQLVTAGALYTTAPLAKFAGKLFLDVNQPQPPAQIFSDKSEAIEWLQQYKNIIA